MIVSDKVLLKRLQEDGHISKDVTWLSAQESVDYGEWLDEDGVPYNQMIVKDKYNPNIRIEI